MPPALSIIDNNLPPNNVSWSLVSPGKMCSIRVTGSLEYGSMVTGGVSSSRTHAVNRLTMEQLPRLFLESLLCVK